MPGPEVDGFVNGLSGWLSGCGAGNRRHSLAKMRRSLNSPVSVLITFSERAVLSETGKNETFLIFSTG